MIQFHLYKIYYVLYMDLDFIKKNKVIVIIVVISLFILFSCFSSSSSIAIFGNTLLNPMTNNIDDTTSNTSSNTSNNGIVSPASTYSVPTPSAPPPSVPTSSAPPQTFEVKYNNKKITKEGSNLIIRVDNVEKGRIYIGNKIITTNTTVNSILTIRFTDGTTETINWNNY
jgi:hypothetical protein